MSDIVERLRNHEGIWDATSVVRLRLQAADEIEQLRERLRDVAEERGAALREIEYRRDEIMQLREELKRAHKDINRLVQGDFL